MFTLENKVEKLATFAVLKHEEAHIIPFPNLMQFYDVWMVEDLQDIDFIYKSRIIFDLLLLDRFDCEKLLCLPVFCQVNDTKASISQLLLEVVLILDVAFSTVDEHGGATAGAFVA